MTDNVEALRYAAKRPVCASPESLLKAAEELETLRARVADQDAESKADNWIAWSGSNKMLFAPPLPLNKGLVLGVMDVRFRWDSGKNKWCAVAYHMQEAKNDNDGWIEWKGGVCPLHADTDVLVVLRNGVTLHGKARDFWWDHLKHMPQNDIVKYRLCNPEDGGWIEWRGGKCPVLLDVWVQVKTRGGGRGQELAGRLRWSHADHPEDIISYRLCNVATARTPPLENTPSR